MSDNAPLILLFDRSTEKVWADICAFIDGHEILSKAVQSRSSTRINFRYDGIGIVVSVVDHGAMQQGAQNIFCNIDPARFQSAISIMLADDMQAATRVAPIAKCLLRAGVLVGKASGAVAAYWKPATTISGFDYFVETVDRYADGGPFPALPLIRFSPEADTMQTDGLDWFAGQEIQFAYGQLTQSAAVQRLVRIVHDIAVNGAVKNKQTVDDCEKLVLEPSADKRVLSVRIV